MAGSVNRVILVGHLGADPEMKYLPSGNGVCEMRLATNESYTDKQGQKQDKVEWHRVVAWGKTAENCAKYLSKGRQIFVEGKLQTRSWEDKDGNKRYTTEIVAQSVVFLGGGGDDGQQRQGGSRDSARQDVDDMRTGRGTSRQSAPAGSAPSHAGPSYGGPDDDLDIPF